VKKGLNKQLKQVVKCRHLLLLSVLCRCLPAALKLKRLESSIVMQFLQPTAADIAIAELIRHI